jgi:hypothetical protein
MDEIRERSTAKITIPCINGMFECANFSVYKSVDTVDIFLKMIDKLFVYCFIGNVNDLTCDRFMNDFITFLGDYYLCVTN